MSLQDKLASIQKDLKAPKNQTNDFGHYKYRSCEDILEAVKPLLSGATLTISDDVVLIGERYYVKATATLRNAEESLSISAFAREEQDKKGMDASQITGAASSYARKYALNGLFCIDDTKDADTRDNSTEKPAQEKQQPKDEKSAFKEGAVISEGQRKRFYAIAKNAGKSDDAIKGYLKYELEIEHTKDMPVTRYEEACKWAETK